MQTGGQHARSSHETSGASSGAIAGTPLGQTGTPAGHAGTLDGHHRHRDSQKYPKLSTNFSGGRDSVRIRPMLADLGQHLADVSTLTKIWPTSAQLGRFGSILGRVRPLDQKSTNCPAFPLDHTPRPSRAQILRTQAGHLPTSGQLWS